MNAATAVRYCEDVTRSQARNFWYGIRLLPEPKRQALASIYAMARRIDDVGDGTDPVEHKRAELDRIEASLVDASPSADDPVVAAVALTAIHFPVPMDAFRDLVDGVRMDLDEHRYATWSDLERYCRRVAGSIGRLSLGVFGARDPDGDARLADDLGVAMQLTNVLRDVREDLERGRLYLPEEDLTRFGVTREDLSGRVRGRPRRAPRHWSASRSAGRATGSSAACRSSRSWIGEARPAPAPWPASTGTCSGASTRLR